MSRNTASKRKADWIASSFGGFGNDFSASQKAKPAQVIDLTDESTDVSNNGIQDVKPWVEKYKPLSELDLAVHKKKIQDVKQILKSYFRDGVVKNEPGIILLTGPAGTGKTALIEVLAKQMNCKLKEWINPVGQEYQERSSGNWRDYLSQQTSQSEAFNDFLLRANRYGGLQMVGDSHQDSNMIVLVEDLPNFVLRDPKKLHEMLRTYLSTGRSPLVFVMSDTHTSDGAVHSIFPKNIQAELKITNISFNGIATTSLVKSMTKIVKEESSLDENLLIPSKEMYDLLVAGCHGDIRSCINSLQFYCTNIEVPVHQEKVLTGTSTKKGAKSDVKPKSKSRKNVKTNRQTTPEEVSSFCGRDASLFLFRALGKVLYSKRTSTIDPIETQLPPHLKQHTRHALQENPEDIFERTQMSSDTFALYLHQNYPQFFASIDDLSNAATYMSCADLIMGAWSSRQILSDYCSSVTTRGIMFSNRGPASASGTVAGGWRPLHKPQWFDNFKTRNQNTRDCKVLFQDTRESTTVLFTDYLPYVNSINTSLKSPDHNLLAQKLGKFSKNKFHQRPQLQTLSDGVQDSTDTGTSSYAEFKYRNKHVNKNELDDVTKVEEDDEDIIEDFDDPLGGCDIVT